MMNEKCAACIHCEVCGFIESEVARDGACDFYEDGKPKFIAKSDGTIEQIKNCNDCIFRKEWEKIGKLLSVILKKQTEQEPCDDTVSRQAVFEQINCWIGSGEYRYTNATHYLTRRMQDLSPVTPQYTDAEIQKMQELEQAEIKKAYELGKAEALDKIRAEIAEYGSIMVAYAITKDTKTDKGIEKLVNGVLKQAKEQVLEIIDKYKAESEETETWNGIHAQITAPKGTFERIFNDADDDNDI